MKKRIVKPLTITAGVLGCCLTLLLMARSGQQANGVFATLAGVPVMELPYTAAQLVSKAPVAERAAMAGEVTRVVASLSKPGMMPFVVSSICRANPDVAVEVVRTAASLQPDEILPIGKAALAAAPSQVEGIVAALCRQEQRAFADVAVMASEQVPSANEKILSGVSVGVPQLAQSIGQARVYTVNQPMSLVMKTTRELATAAAQSEMAVANRKALELALDNGGVAKVGGQAKSLGVVELASLGSPVQTGDNALSTRASLGAMPNVFSASTPLFEPPPPQAPPVVGPPFTPYSGSSEFNANNGTVLPPGSPRSYSGP